eukprot:TRINITY_DN30758_c0_g1_i2.p1 TRINITY_DN30758_c0_g1~~TRINITY_DN30758_c0_g1_i2.p1  ORF type:complete len:186 (-),score=28.58 TRINITY_DN30758_c0_g1_i2:70-627(-)
MALFGPKLDWLSRAFSSFFGPVERSRTYSAQLLLREGNDVLLGEHTKAGLFPGRLSGLIADSYKPGQDAGLEALAAAAKNYGIDLDLTRCRAVGRMEFVEADAPHEVSEEVQFICDAVAAVRATMKAPANASWLPQWTPLDDIPYGRMPADDRLWYPSVLRDGKRVGGRFTFDGELCTSCVLWEE